jgi:hypothetical protein
MTFKDLQRLIRPEGESETNPSSLQMLRDKEFWIWSRPEHKNKHRVNNGNCCFNHTIGLPTKDGVEKPMFDYERTLYRPLLEPAFLNSIPTSSINNIEAGSIAYPFKHKHLFVKKATGLGITEFMLRFMAWLCLYDDSYRNSQMVIVTGPNQELAIKLIKRMKELFVNLGINFQTKETVLELNGCRIEAFPSHHLDTLLEVCLQLKFCILMSLHSSLMKRNVCKFPSDTLRNRILIS